MGRGENPKIMQRQGEALRNRLKRRLEHGDVGERTTAEAEDPAGGEPPSSWAEPLAPNYAPAGTDGSSAPGPDEPSQTLSAPSAVAVAERESAEPVPDEKTIGAIFGNADNKSEFLHRLDPEEFKTPSTAKRKFGAKELDAAIARRWDGERVRLIVREMFFATDKAAEAKQAGQILDQYRREMAELGLDLNASYNPARISQQITEFERKYRGRLMDKSVAEEYEKKSLEMLYSKGVHSMRNDWIEHVMLTSHEEIVPTLKHRKGVDFVIHGDPFDQKVSRSVGKAFKQQYGESWRSVAKEHPELVARSLYENQSQAQQYGEEPRLFVVFLDEDVSAGDIERCVEQADFSEPLSITFENPRGEQVDTKAFVLFIERQAG